MPLTTYRDREILLAPSILAADFARLGEQVRAADEAGADRIHTDIMDGHFVPNISFGPLVVAAIRPVTHRVIDVHLMIEHPEQYIDAFVKAGANHITVHAEATRHLHRVIHQIKAEGATAGVVLNPATPLVTVEDVLADIDLVLLMSVNPGFGGQSYIPHTGDRLRRMREQFDRRGLDHVQLQVDGGITAMNVREVVEAGATNIVAGSAIFGHKDGVAAGVEEFRRALR